MSFVIDRRQESHPIQYCLYADLCQISMARTLSQLMREKRHQGSYLPVVSVMTWV